MKVLFLDIDGVLVTDKPGKFDRSLLEQLVRVVQRTGCHIVLSSDWRRRPEGLSIVRQQLQQVGLDLLGHCRPTVADEERPLEIADWIRDRAGSKGPEVVTHYVVLDDRSLFREKGGDEYMHGHFVQTRLIKGLTAEKADEAIAVLEAPPAPNDLLQTAAESEQNEALLLLQRMLRGRAAQNRLWVEKEDYLERQLERRKEAPAPEPERLFALAAEASDPGPCPASFQQSRWECEKGCGYRHRDFEAVEEHERECRYSHEESAKEAAAVPLRPEALVSFLEGMLKARGSGKEEAPPPPRELATAHSHRGGLIPSFTAAVVDGEYLELSVQLPGVEAIAELDLGIAAGEMDLYGKGYGVRIVFGCAVHDDRQIAAAFDRANKDLHVRLALKGT
jgi:hypothetical protein